MISVVIPNYNRRDCVLALLKDVYLQEGVEFEVIVVDDCSPDNSVVAVREAFPQATVLVNEKNSGPAVSRNRGVKAARGQVIVGLDNDVTIPDRHLLAKLAKKFEENPQMTGAASRIFQPDGQTEDVPRWWHPRPIKDYAAREFQTSYFSGTAYAFRRAEMLAAGLFPEILYMHYEEVELAFRILDNQGEILYLPDFQVVHHANKVSRRSEIQVFYKPRNQILITLRCYPILRGLTYILPRFAFGGTRAVVRGHFKDFCRALRSARALAPLCLKQRKALEKETWLRIDRMKQGIHPSPSKR